VDEFELIRRYFTRELIDADVRIGIGDDGAVMRPTTGRDLVAVMDTLVEGVHFPVDLGAADIGWRAVAVNLSDIAAMAATPRWMTLALTLREANPDWLQDFSSGLFAAAEEHSISLVGGDTTRGQQNIISIQICGDVDPDFILTRAGARVRDLICVSGTLGDAAAGLNLLQSNSVMLDADNDLIRRFRRPNARVSLAQTIAPHASAAIDISDGLYGDIQKLLRASDTGGRIELDSIPLSSTLVEQFGLDRAQQFALGGGDDYELCFTLPAGSEALLSEFSQQHTVRISCIGVVTDNHKLICTRQGEPFNYVDQGYHHFGASGS